MIDFLFGWALLLFVPAIFAYAASSDLFAMRISNKLVLLFVAPFPIVAYGMGMDWSQFGYHLLTAIGVLIPAYFFWSINQIGGGDAKFAVIAALWFGPWVSFLFLTFTSVYGLILVVVMMRARAVIMPTALWKMDWLVRLYQHKKIPYGIALGIAGLQMYATSDYMREGVLLVSS